MGRLSVNTLSGFSSVNEYESALAAVGRSNAVSESDSLLNSLVMMIDDSQLDLDILQICLEEVGFHRFVVTSDSNQ